MHIVTPFRIVLVVAAGLVPHDAIAQSGEEARARTGRAEARAEVSALRVNGSDIRVDGRLDEGAWRTATAASEFRQREPTEGAAATERTDVRVLYDGTTIYIGVHATDGQPDEVIARLLQRDRLMQMDFGGGPTFGGDDAVAIMLDTFDDHRNAFLFATNPNGAEFDALVTDEGREFNVDWRGVWQVKAIRTADGWSAEFAIPLATLRYPEGRTVWGLNVSRMIRRKNEETLWQSWERDGGGFMRVSRAGHLTGLDDLPREGRTIEVKPYTLGAFDHERVDAPTAGGPAGARSVASGSGGLDIKTELRPGLVLDATLNTDFAQVEVDDQQVNLTQFSLFLPEKREFFLENAGIFQFGAPGSFGPPPFQLFFSRRIGLASDGAVPVLGGARVTGRVGRQTLGFLDIVTDSASFGEPGRNFGVMRVKRDVGESGYVGAMVTDRRNTSDTDIANTAGGLDWSFWPTRSLNVQGFAARTTTSGIGGDGAYRLAANYQTGRFGFTGQHFAIGPDVRARSGFITRTDIRQSDTFTRLTFRPRTLGLRTVQIFYVGAYATRMDGLRMDANNGVALDNTWNSGDSFTMFANAGRSRIDEDFDLSDSVTVDIGDYSNSNAGLFASTSGARPVSATVFAQQQWNYGGSVLSINSNATIAGGPHVNFGLGHTYGDVSLPNGSFRFNLASARVNVAFTTRLFLNSLVQMNTLDRELSANLRLQYMFRPGSDIYLVFGEQRGSRENPWVMEGRSVRLKVTWLARL